MKNLVTTISCLLAFSCSEKKDVKSDFFLIRDTVIAGTNRYFILDMKGDTVRKLNPEKYFFILNDTIENLIVVAPRERNDKHLFWAIDLNENFLFPVYNRTIGEPDHDEISDGMIRTVDDNGKIGYANKVGKIVIKPQFEAASPFYKNYAIIGKTCKNVPALGAHPGGECQHLHRECKEYGYIDKAGKVLEIGKHSEEDLKQKLKFPNTLY